MKSLAIDTVLTRRRGLRFDFVVSGKSLLHKIEQRGFDLLPRLGGKLVPVDMETRAVLLCESRGDMPSGRVALYVCPECGDYGCGVVSARIERDGDTVVWRDFGYETDYEEEHRPIEKLGPFRFRWSEYRQALNC